MHFQKWNIHSGNGSKNGVKNYIVNINNIPFTLKLQNGDHICAENILRVMPKQRLVIAGTCNDQPIVAKIFLNKNKGARHLQNEMRGITLLQKHNIPTPELYYLGQCADNRYHLIIFKHIQHATTLEEIWRNKTSLDGVTPTLFAIMRELATQHAYGILQHDLHLKNFLIREQIIYTLDGAQIGRMPTPLSKKQSLHAIGLFLSQLGVGIEYYQAMLYQHYAQLRGFLTKQKDFHQLFSQISMHNHSRWLQYQKKIFRTATDFLPIKQRSYQGMVDRHALSPALSGWLKDPESAFSNPSCLMLKKGRSSTVIKITFDRCEERPF